MSELTVLSQTELYQILDEYRRRLLAALPGQIERLILYGSYARGEAHAESDVDVLVVVNWPQKRRPDGFYEALYSDPRWRAIVDIATEMMLDYGVVISPKVFSVSRFEQGVEPLVAVVKKEGIEVWQQNKILHKPG